MLVGDITGSVFSRVGGRYYRERVLRAGGRYYRERVITCLVGDITRSSFSRINGRYYRERVFTCLVGDITGSVFAALCRGLITNLHNMMSQDVLRRNGVQRIVGSGTALVKNKLLQVCEVCLQVCV